MKKLFFLMQVNTKDMEMFHKTRTNFYILLITMISQIKNIDYFSNPNKKILTKTILDLIENQKVMKNSIFL